VGGPPQHESRGPSSDPAVRQQYVIASAERRAELEDEADQLHQRAVLCAFYGISGAEHDELSMEQLDAMARVMNRHRER
jgi:hypothetical protein